MVHLLRLAATRVAHHPVRALRRGAPVWLGTGACSALPGMPRGVTTPLGLVLARKTPAGRRLSDAPRIGSWRPVTGDTPALLLDAAILLAVVWAVPTVRAHALRGATNVVVQSCAG
jgi:hypothetical protein